MKKTCFVIMPFSDIEGYEAGHFGRVYEHLIHPACIAADLEPIRGDEVKSTNYIAIDILHRTLRSDLVICDISGKNANVLYELGVRQAFDLPVVLIKDKRTDRVFDIQGLRTLDYTESLRIDSVQRERDLLKKTISATLALEPHEVNSLVALLGIEKATLGKPTEVSAETALILSSLKDVAARLSALEEAGAGRKLSPGAERVFTQFRNLAPPEKVTIGSDTTLTVGDQVFDLSSGKHEALGVLLAVNNNGLIIKSPGGAKFVLPPDDPRFQKLSDVPF